MLSSGLLIGLVLGLCAGLVGPSLLKKLKQRLGGE